MLKNTRYYDGETHQIIMTTRYYNGNTYVLVTTHSPRYSTRYSTLGINQGTMRHPAGLKVVYVP